MKLKKFELLDSTVVLHSSLEDERSELPVGTFTYDGAEIGVAQVHCIDKLGPDESGKYLFYYEYDTYAFSHGNETLRARSYADNSEEAHFLVVNRAGNRESLSEEIMASSLARAAINYLSSMGKRTFKWLDPSNEESGYSELP